MPLPENRPAASRLSDAELVARIVAGDGSAFEPLMRRYNRPLYRTARSIVKDDAEAEDVLQDAWVLALRRLDTFRGDAQLLTWLTRIVANEAIARIRTATRRARILPIDASVAPDPSDPVQDVPDTDDDGPEGHAMRAEMRQLLEDRIDRLPESFRTVFVLRAVEDMTVEEVGAALGLPEATVRTRHFRARSMLRAMIEQDLEGALGDAFNFDGERCNRIVAAVLAALAAGSRQA